MRWVILVLLMVSFATAVEIDFDCPREIFAGEEFECSLEVTDGDGEYDVKIDLDGERNSVCEVFNDGVWKSGYFYLQEFIEDGDDRDVRLRVSEDGNYDGVLKLRQGDKREFFDVEIDVEIREEVEILEEVEGEIEDEGIVLLEVEPGIISLNGDVVSQRDDLGEPDEVDELVYVSKDAKVVDWLPYGFGLFLIFVIGILLIDKF